MSRTQQSGFSFVELLVSLAVFSLVMASLAGVLVENSRINKSELMRAEVQANARNCASLVAERLRSAGWDPWGLGFAALTLDDDTSDAVSFIEIFADLDGDGDIDDEGEAVLIRHVGDTVEWRTSTGGSLVPLAVGISNDADGDGTPEPMFVPDSMVGPTQVRVRVTAQSPVPDPRTRQPIRYTVETEVALRTNL